MLITSVSLLLFIPMATFFIGETMGNVTMKLFCDPENFVEGSGLTFGMLPCTLTKEAIKRLNYCDLLKHVITEMTIRNDHYLKLKLEKLNKREKFERIVYLGDKRIRCVDYQDEQHKRMELELGLGLEEEEKDKEESDTDDEEGLLGMMERMMDKMGMLKENMEDKEDSEQLIDSVTRDLEKMMEKRREEEEEGEKGKKEKNKQKREEKKMMRKKEEAQLLMKEKKGEGGETSKKREEEEGQKERGEVEGMKEERGRKEEEEGKGKEQ